MRHKDEDMGRIIRRLVKKNDLEYPVAALEGKSADEIQGYIGSVLDLYVDYESFRRGNVKDPECCMSEGQRYIFECFLNPEEDENAASNLEKNEAKRLFKANGLGFLYSICSEGVKEKDTLAGLDLFARACQAKSAELRKLEGEEEESSLSPGQ